MAHLTSRVGGYGGVIMLDYAHPGAAGVAVAFNTSRMAFAFQTSEDSGPVVGLERSDIPAEALVG